MRTEEVYLEALRLFKIVHGPGDDGSTHAFNCLNAAIQDGWMKLARHVLRRVDKAGEPQYGPRSEDC